MRSIVQKSPIPESKAFIVQHLHSSYFDPNIHAHTEYQLFYVLEGRGNRFIGDNIKPFKEGDIVFTGPNMPHLWRSDMEYFNKAKGLKTSGIVLYLREDFLGGSIHQKEELESLHHLFKRSLNGLEITGNTNKQLRKMLADILNMKGLESIIQLLKILQLMAGAADDCQTITHASYQYESYNEKEKNRMNLVYEYVMQNFKQKIELDQVASLVNMTPTSFSRFFTSRVNKSFSDFVKEIRIDYACKMLHDEHAPVSRIAYECGFPTLSNFNKQFKIIKDETPLSYRKKYQNIVK